MLGPARARLAAPVAASLPLAYLLLVARTLPILVRQILLAALEELRAAPDRPLQTSQAHISGWAEVAAAAEALATVEQVEQPLDTVPVAAAAAHLLAEHPGLALTAPLGAFWL
jgi:hypothetical protein